MTFQLKANDNLTMKKKWFAYLGFLILPILLINSYWRNLQLKKDPRFTITTTIRQIRTLKNGLQIEHFYYVNNKMYKDTYRKDERLNIIYPNGKYLLRFSLSHPDVCVWYYGINQYQTIYWKLL